MPIRPPTENAGAGSGGGGGSAGAIGLGPETNTFADTTARDAYATNNPGWLRQYNANRSFWISVGTGFQRRNAGGTAWQDVTPVVQGADGEDGADGTQVMANPSGTDGDALTRIAIDGTNYTVEGTGGTAASWDRRLNPMITSLGWKPNASDGVDFNTATPRSFITNGSAPTRYIGIELPDDLRYAIRNSQLGLSIRLSVRVRSSTSTTPSVLRFALYDGESSFTVVSTETVDRSFAMNIGGTATGHVVLDLPAGTNIGTSGNLYIRVIWRSSPGSNTVTVDMHEITASVLDTSAGLTEVSPTDLDGISSATAGRLVAIGTDTGEFQQIDPANVGGTAVTWDRRLFPQITVQGYRQPNRQGTLQTGDATLSTTQRSAYFQFDMPQYLRQAIADGALGVSIRFTYRIQSTTGATPVVVRSSVFSHSNSNNVGGLAGISSNISHSMADDGTDEGTIVFDIPRMVEDLDVDANPTYIWLGWISSPGTVTVDNVGIEVATYGSSGGISSVEPSDLDGISSPTATNLIGIATDTTEFVEVAQSDITSGIVTYDIFAQSGSGRNVLADADRIPFAYAAGSGQPNRWITFENFKYELQLPYIAQFNVIGRNRVAAGTDIGGDTYRYSLQIGNPGHVGAARIVGFFRDSGEDPSPISPPTPSVLATIASGTYAHASGEVTIPDNQNLALAGDTYTIRLEVYEDGQTAATDRPFAYHDYPIVSQADSGLTHFGSVLSTEAVADIVFADDDISTAHGVAGSWVVSGLPNSGLHRLYWAVPTTDTQPVDWHQGGTSIAPTIGAAVERMIGSVTYNVYMFAAANAVSDSFNGQTIVVTT